MLVNYLGLFNNELAESVVLLSLLGSFLGVEVFVESLGLVLVPDVGVLSGGFYEGDCPVGLEYIVKLSIGHSFGNVLHHQGSLLILFGPNVFLCLHFEQFVLEPCSSQSPSDSLDNYRVFKLHDCVRYTLSAEVFGDADVVDERAGVALAAEIGDELFIDLKVLWKIC